MKLLIFDTETTGLKKDKNGIHQMSGIIIVDNVIKDTFDIKFRPFEDCLIEEAALKVNNTSLNELINRNLSEKDAHDLLCSILDKHVNKYDKLDKFFLLGYNVEFDLGFLSEMFKRNKDNFLMSYIWKNPLDVMQVALENMLNVRPLLPDFKQGTVARTLGLQLNENRLHDALYDIVVCMNIYSKVTGKIFTVDENVNKDLISL